jgi:hypothetical protein
VDLPSRKYARPVWDSYPRTGVKACLGIPVLALVLAGGWAHLNPPARDEAQSSRYWRVGAPVSIAVHDGHASFCAETRLPKSEILVVVSAISRARGPFPIELTVKPASSAMIPDVADDGVATEPKSPVRPNSERREPEAPSGPPAPYRTFHMLVRDGDAASPSNYIAIRGALKGIGRKVQVYVATEDVDQVGRELVDDIVDTFDARILPLTTARFGAARDVDGDGRFTILLSSWLDHLAGGRYAVDGFVRVADLDTGFVAPFGNRCDMMYLSTALKSGPYLRTVLAHEYMHAVIFSEKTLCGASGSRGGPEEEEWLDEAMAHLAEDLHGFSTSNIDYRVSAFLASPERYQLVVDDYYAADLFRSHGNRGSTYLFLRWCAENYGPGLVSRLVHSRLRGTANLEEATGATFANLYRRWSLSLCESGWKNTVKGTEPSNQGRAGGALARALDACDLSGPRCTRVGPEHPIDRWTALGTSSHFIIVEGSSAGAVEVEVSGPPEAQLQVTALPLGADSPRLELTVRRIAESAGKSNLSARIRERNGVPVRLTSLAWEPVTPGPNTQSGGARGGQLGEVETAAAFGSEFLAASGEVLSRPIPIAGITAASGPMVVKVVGKDATGKQIAAWADLP